MCLLISPNSRKHSDCNRLIISVAFCYFLRQGPISSLGARIFPKIGLSALSRAGAFAPIWRKSRNSQKSWKTVNLISEFFLGRRARYLCRERDLLNSRKFPTFVACLYEVQGARKSVEAIWMLRHRRSTKWASAMVQSKDRIYIPDESSSERRSCVRDIKQDYERCWTEIIG